MYPAFTILLICCCVVPIAIGIRSVILLTILPRPPSPFPFGEGAVLLFNSKLYIFHFIFYTIPKKIKNSSS